MKIKGIKKSEFKKKLAEKTMCSIQHNGWTCGTCFYDYFKHTTNEDWRSVLYYRGDYSLEELNLDAKYKLTIRDIEERIKNLWAIMNNKTNKIKERIEIKKGFLEKLDEMESKFSMIKNVYYGTDDKGNIIIDEEGMREEFENELKGLVEFIK